MVKITGQTNWSDSSKVSTSNTKKDQINVTDWRRLGDTTTKYDMVP